MKILSVFNHYLERGGEAYAVDFICNSLSQILELERCEFFSADWIDKEKAPSRWQQAAWMIRNPKSIQRLHDQQQRFGADAWLLHNVFPVGSAAIYGEAQRLGVPVVQYAHNFRPFSVNGYAWANHRIVDEGIVRNYLAEIRYGAWQESRIKTAWFAFTLSILRARGAWKEIAAWIAISDFMREHFIKAGVPASDIFTLRHFWRLRGNVLATPGKNYLYLGRLTEAKGVLVLLEAWEIVERKLAGAAPRLLIAGDGPLRAVLKARAERMRQVELVGHLGPEAKSRALGEAKAVVVPSIWWEPLGLVVYEAYDNARPVLAARSGGLPEIVVDKETGLLHAPGSAEELADHILQLEKEVDRCVEMGNAGRRWLEASANEAEWQKEIIRIFHYATTNRRREIPR